VHNGEEEIGEFEKTGYMNITQEKPRLFKVGNIIEDPSELIENYEYTFYMCRLAVGKSYCYKRSQENLIQ
jgi:hypothetical protein